MRDATLPVAGDSNLVKTWRSLAKTGFLCIHAVSVLVGSSNTHSDGACSSGTSWALEVFLQCIESPCLMRLAQSMLSSARWTSSSSCTPTMPPHHGHSRRSKMQARSRSTPANAAAPYITETPSSAATLFPPRLAAYPCCTNQHHVPVAHLHGTHVI